MKKLKKPYGGGPTKGSKVCIPAMLSDDRTSVTLSNGREYIFVRHPVKNNFYFTAREKVIEGQMIVPVGEQFGVIENTFTHIPIRVKLHKLVRLIKQNGGKQDGEA